MPLPEPLSINQRGALHPQAIPSTSLLTTPSTSSLGNTPPGPPVIAAPSHPPLAGSPPAQWPPARASGASVESWAPQRHHQARQVEVPARGGHGERQPTALPGHLLQDQAGGGGGRKPLRGAHLHEPGGLRRLSGLTARLGRGQRPGLQPGVAHPQRARQRTRRSAALPKPRPSTTPPASAPAWHASAATVQCALAIPRPLPLRHLVAPPCHSGSTPMGRRRYWGPQCGSRMLTAPLQWCVAQRATPLSWDSAQGPLLPALTLLPSKPLGGMGLARSIPPLF